MPMNINTGVRAARKTLITVAEWTVPPTDVFILQTVEPDDWSSKYNTYYIKVGGAYEKVSGGSAPTWTLNTYYTKTEVTTHREILGARTEDSSIEFNPDVETSQDILGKVYTDVNKTEPQQDFDPFYILGGSALAEYLSDAALENRLDAYSGAFTLYIIEAYKGNTGNGFKCVKHANCSIIPTSLGGDAYVSMPIEVHFSNDITVGTVDSLNSNFVFTPAN
jgi:hypothetical protein